MCTLMIQQKGCISEKLLRCRDAHEFISYSEWDSASDISAYTAGNAHKEIVRHTRALRGSKAVVKLYDLVQYTACRNNETIVHPRRTMQV
jgi:heme-degrading monooxygenase HmoA